MTLVKNGDKVRVHYHGKLNDGSTFDSSEGRPPLEFQVGEGQVIKGFDDALLEMKIGDKKTVIIPVANAYGEPHPENIIEYPLSDFPEDMKPEIGLELHMSDNQGNNFPVVITAITDNSVVLDANHPLAGKELTFDIELVEII
ncbi:MAG: peptidylprolyl isomerase [Phycisphaerales bacterium]|nr:peptidylprolyl isomerase [Phycisphaerales bacterium]